MTREEIYSRFEELDKRASLGGGVDKIEKQHAQGKMTARERIGMLLDIRPVLKLILGTALLGVISYYMPALLFFVLIGVWHFFVNDIFDPVYQNIHEKLVS